MKRGAKIVLVAHCILNQNARVAGLATYPGSVKEVANLLINSEVGVIQLPCSETTFAGLNRWEAVKEQYDTMGFREHCREILKPYLDQIREHVKQGHKILAILGVTGSPCCALRNVPSNPEWKGAFSSLDLKVPKLKMERGKGIFMEELLNGLKERGIEIDEEKLIEVSDFAGELEERREEFIGRNIEEIKRVLQN